ncbi:hypothetical protein SAMN05444392_11510 [Seinonella peptonophila]|uniref:Uncharacterized protein n=1 Tax=Seinonella peptonophila TaxID=112248 RepID=A0A1M5AP80_9BACL|nr:hypothetical protein [Seinonella peptonophila]SHF31712.1 hypothetical protein SAMN05444392_11510 [Seinonella peptonophila]
MGEKQSLNEKMNMLIPVYTGEWNQQNFTPDQMREGLEGLEELSKQLEIIHHIREQPLANQERILTEICELIKPLAEKLSTLTVQLDEQKVQPKDQAEDYTDFLRVWPVEVHYKGKLLSAIEKDHPNRKKIQLQELFERVTESEQDFLANAKEIRAIVSKISKSLLMVNSQLNQTVQDDVRQAIERQAILEVHRFLQDVGQQCTDYQMIKENPETWKGLRLDGNLGFRSSGQRKDGRSER